MRPESPTLENDNQQSWKRRYDDTLDELETKERQWRELELLLRQLISRLTLAADSRSTDLNSQLCELRNAIRDGKDSLSLRPLIDSISDTIVRLDEQHQGADQTDAPGRWLQALFADYPVPKALQHRVDRLNERLMRLERDDDLAPVVAEVAAVFEGIILQRDSRAVPPAAADELPPKAQKLVAPAVGELLLQLALRLPDRVKRRLDLAAMRRVTTKAKRRKDLLPVVDSLAGHIEAAFEHVDVGQPVALDESSLQSLRAALVALLEEFRTPDDLSPRVDSVRRRLTDTSPQPEVFVDTLRALAGIVGELCARLNAQYTAVENFLKQLTERLQEVDQELQQSGEIHDARHDSDARLSDAISSDVRELRTRMQDADDLETLKGEVHDRLASIDEHLLRFQQAAADYDAQTRERMAELQARVGELELEGTVLKQALVEHRDLAVRDALTKLPTRQAYDERIALELARARRYGKPLSVVVWDVDHFKQLNDTYGHTAGDKLLKVLAETLNSRIRETDFLGRCGGEEFVMLMPETAPDQARDVADKLREAIAGMPFHFRNVPVKVTVSAGISYFEEPDTTQSLFERADRALYEAKQQGRNRVWLAGQ